MIIVNHIGYKEEAQGLLRIDLVKHRSGVCDCIEQRGVVYPCKASEWLRGIVSSKQIVEDYHYEKSNT